VDPGTKASEGREERDYLLVIGEVILAILESSKNTERHSGEVMSRRKPAVQGALVVFLVGLVVTGAVPVLSSAGGASAASCPYTLGGTATDGALEIEVDCGGNIGVDRYDGSSFVEQYFSFDSSDTAVYVGGTVYDIPGGGTSDAGNNNLAVSDQYTTNGGDTVVTEYSDPGAGFTLVQRVTYSGTQQYFDLSWDVTNVNDGNGDLTGVRLLHGKDTYLAGGDSGEGFWNSGTNTIGVKKDVSGEENRLTLRGLTDPYNYQSDGYSSISSSMTNGELTGNVDTSFHDNGYAMEWRTSSIADGNTWTVNARESFTLSSVVVTPPSKQTLSGDTVDLTFDVQNTGSSDTSVSFTTSGPSGWSITTPSDRTINAGTTDQVTVTADPPDTVSAGDYDVTLTASPSSGSSDSGTGVVEVTDTNDPPTASDDSTVTDEDSSVTDDVVANDTDPDGDSLDVSSITNGPSHGTVQITGASNDQIQFDPGADESGDVSITYEVSDGNGGTDTATLSVTVNDAPEVSSVTRSDSNPTNAASVDFDVTFSESVSNVDVSDFTATQVSGTVAGSVSGVSGSGSSYTVTVDSINGDGDLRLDLSDDDSITNGNGVPLGGVGTTSNADGSYTSGEVYTVDNTDPVFSAGSTNTASVNEETTASNFLNVDAGNDGTPGSEVSDYSLSSAAGSDASVFSIDSSTGKISLDNALDHESPTDDNTNNDYELAVTATDDAGNSNTQTVTVMVNNVNEAPTLSTDTRLLDTIDEDATANGGTQVSTILASAGTTDDEDGDTPGVAITGVDDTDGTWEYSIDGGSSWSTVSPASDANALLLADDDLVRFVPNADFSGTAGGSVTVRAWDQTSGSPGLRVDTTTNGGTTAYSSNTATASISIDDAPEVSSIARASPSSPTNASSVVFTVTFSESVDGIDASDFTPSGAPTGSISSVSSSSGASIDVTVDSVSGDGNLRLDLSDDDSITNGNGVPLGGVGLTSNADGSYTSGETYTVDNTAPTLVGATKIDDTTIEIDSSESDAGFDASTIEQGDFSLDTGTIASIDKSTISDGETGTQTVTINLASAVDDDTVTVSLQSDGIDDLAGNTKDSGSVDATNMDGVEPTVDGAAKVDTTTIEVDISEAGSGIEKGSIESGDFSLDSGSISSIDRSSVTDGGTGTQTVIINLASAVDADTVTVSLQSDGIGDKNGNTQTTGSASASGMDGVAPTLDGASKVDDTTIQVTITDGVDVDETTISASDFSVSGGSISSVTPTESGPDATVAIDLASAVDADSVDISVVGSIDDTSGNSLTSGTQIASNMDGVAPTLDDATRVDDTTIDVDISDAGSGIETASIESADFSLDSGSISSIDTSDVTDGGTGTQTVIINLASVVDADTVSVNLQVDGIDDMNGNTRTTGSATASNMDGVAPTITSIERSPGEVRRTNASSVDFAVSFSEGVESVGTDDFGLDASGSTSGDVSGVSTTDGSSVVVTVSSITGDGSLGLDVTGGDITDGDGNALNPSEPDIDEIYAIDNTAPAFDNDATVSIEEAVTGSVLDIEAGDDEPFSPDTNVTYRTDSPVGDDTDFSINSSTGRLSLTSEKDFENPGDADGDNDYELAVTATDDVGNEATQSVTVTVTDTNDLPTANEDAYRVSRNQSISVGAATGLLANDRDVDADDGIENFTASLVTDVDNGTVDLAANGSFRYTPDRGFGGTDSFTYELHDGDGGTATATVTLTLDNDPPLAIATADATVREGETVDLVGTFSRDPNEDPLTHEWRQTRGPDVNLSDTNSSVVRFTAPEVNETTELGFGLSVYDGQLGASTVLEITVEPGDEEPVADAGPNVTVTAGESATLDGSGSYDPDGDELTYEWRQVSGPDMAVTGTGVNATVVAPEGAENRTATVRLAVSEGSETATDTVTVRIRPPEDSNAPPAARVGPDRTVSGGTEVTLDATNSTDPDDDSLSFRWTQTVGPEVTLSDRASATPTFTAPSVESSTTLAFRVTVDDGDARRNATIKVTVDHSDSVLDRFDENDDGAISTPELQSAIRTWASGGITTDQLQTVIRAWATGR
jgi:hypothetical protein